MTAKSTRCSFAKRTTGSGWVGSTRANAFAMPDQAGVLVGGGDDDLRLGVGESVGDRVLAGAAADDQDAHGRSAGPRAALIAVLPEPGRRPRRGAWLARHR